jgi:hypothetical protein
MAEKTNKTIKTTLISFKSGHYKTVKGSWKGDSVWMHFTKENGKMVHINKDEVEYAEEL